MSSPRPATNPTRRQVVRGVGAAGVAVTAVAGLAACGDHSTGAGSSSPPAGSSSGAAASISVATSKVSVGSGYIDSTNKIVVTQPVSGTYKAFSSVCPHEGCQVTKIEDKKIECPCHGSTFDLSTGDVIDGPATSGLPTKTATTQGGVILVS